MAGFFGFFNNFSGILGLLSFIKNSGNKIIKIATIVIKIPTTNIRYLLYKLLF